jgi:hypothetical protein
MTLTHGVTKYWEWCNKRYANAKLSTQSYLHKAIYTKLSTQNYLHKTIYTKLSTQNYLHKAIYTKLSTQNYLHKATPCDYRLKPNGHLQQTVFLLQLACAVGLLSL